MLGSELQVIPAALATSLLTEMKTAGFNRCYLLRLRLRAFTLFIGSQTLRVKICAGICSESFCADGNPGTYMYMFLNQVVMAIRASLSP